MKERGRLARNKTQSVHNLTFDLGLWSFSLL